MWLHFFTCWIWCWVCFKLFLPCFYKNNLPCFNSILIFLTLFLHKYTSFLFHYICNDIQFVVTCDYISLHAEFDVGSCFCCPQLLCSTFMRKHAQDHPLGWLLPFILCLELNPRGMLAGAIPRRRGALSWWWNAMTACMRDGMSRQRQHTVRDGQTN